MSTCNCTKQDGFANCCKVATLTAERDRAREESTKSMELGQQVIDSSMIIVNEAKELRAQLEKAREELDQTNEALERVEEIALESIRERDELRATVQRLEGVINTLKQKFDSVIAKSHSWVICEETAYILVPVHEGYRNLAREALAACAWDVASAE